MYDKEETVLQGNGKFTRQLYKILSEDSGNVFFSPFGAHTVLSTVYQTAKGATKDAFASTLSLPDPIVAAKGYRLIMSELNNIRGVQLHIANKIYLKDCYQMQISFQDTVEKKFLSEVAQMKFEENVKAASCINGWVESKTNNKIKDLINAKSLDGNTSVVLVNAIYFKGDWQDQFDPKLTKTETFYLNEIDTVQCQMMARKEKYMFKNDKNLDAQLLKLPYKNRNVSLIVILPNERDGIADLEARLSTADLTKLSEDMYKTKVDVKLPRFRIETTINLDDTLNKMGLGIIFDERADLSGMIDSHEPLSVSHVIQKAFIEVNEEGTAAAVATAPLFRYVKKEFEEEFFADHPFVVALQIRQFNFSNILFMGRLSKPDCEVI